MNRKQSLPAGRQGFTLIELLIVMVILGVLLVLGSGAFFSSLQKGRDTTRKGNVRSITTALEMYYNDKGKYPVGVNGEIKGCGSDAAPTLCADGVFKDANNTLYMAKIPADPVGSQKYYYVSATGTQYQIYARLENNLDPAIDPNIISESHDCATGAVPIICNWGLSSANTNP